MHVDLSVKFVQTKFLVLHVMNQQRIKLKQAFVNAKQVL